MCDADIMSGPRSISRSSLINTADRFRKLGPPSIRACAQFRHLQKASGKAFAEAVPRKVIVMCGCIPDARTKLAWSTRRMAAIQSVRLAQSEVADDRAPSGRQ